MTKPPDNLPIYRVLTGPDDAAFCHRVSDALTLGYKLLGSPSCTFNGSNVVLAQAIIWSSAEMSVATVAADFPYNLLLSTLARLHLTTRSRRTATPPLDSGVRQRIARIRAVVRAALSPT